MSWYKTATPKKMGGGVEIVTFADGTDEQIAAMIQAYYDGTLTLADIQDVWSVGDKRSISISAMSATGVSEAHHADDYEYVILDFDHDILTTPINGITKALITCQQDRIFFTDTTTEYDTSFDTAHEYGYMNSSDSNYGGWGSCARRTWCNNTYYNALPQYLKDSIKEVNKLTSAGSQSSTINTTADKAFLPSEIEIYGSTTYSFAGEGSQYAYFANATVNRYKKPAYDTSFPSSIWWVRSPRSSRSDQFCNVTRNGGAAYYGASLARGLAPAFCL